MRTYVRFRSVRPGPQAVCYELKTSSPEHNVLRQRRSRTDGQGKGFLIVQGLNGQVVRPQVLRGQAPLRDQRALCHRCPRQAQSEYHGEGVEVAVGPSKGCHPRSLVIAAGATNLDGGRIRWGRRCRRGRADPRRLSVRAPAVREPVPRRSRNRNARRRTRSRTVYVIPLAYG